MTKEVPRTSVLRDEELIAYLRLQGLDKDIAAADRIEQLVATNEALSISNATLIDERDQWVAHAKNAIWSDSEQLRLAEAELAKVVEAAEKVINSYWHSTDGVITGIYDLEASLAEIKSHSDEFATQKGETHE